jgi:erythromycin esterase
MQPLPYQLCLTLLLAAGSLSAQDHLFSYVRSNTHILNTVDPDSATDDDLAAIGQAIGDSRIVMLGEQDHGDAPTFLAKTRLIRYLHEKKGFNVLAFESDFFGLNEGWARLPRDPAAIDSFIRYNIFPIWTYCNTCQELFYSYIPASFRTDHPLQLAGFDCQMLLRYSRSHLVGWLDSVFHDLQLPVVNDPAYQGTVLPLLDSVTRRWYNWPGSPRDMAAAAKWFDTIAAQVVLRLDAEQKRTDFRWFVIHSLLDETKEYLNIGRLFQMSEARDVSMAANLTWLTDVRYAGQKVIVWAADAHVGKAVGHFPEIGFYNRTPTMGSEFVRDPMHLAQTYVLGFTSFEGRAGRLTGKQYTLYRPRAGSFEHLFDKEVRYAFVDFRQYNALNAAADESFVLYGFRHVAVKGVWNKVFDGVFYIREMYPCELVK